MSDNLLFIPGFIVLLATLIMFHELGHFTVSKLLKIKVEEFAFGFGPKWITMFKIGDTEYTIHPVPLGGFVKTAGAEPGEEDVPNGFLSKPWWARALVFIAGPFMSFVLAYLIFCAMGLTVGLPITGEVDNVVDLIQPGSEAENIGLRVGDRIVMIDYQPIDSGQTMLDMVHGSAYRSVEILVGRGKETIHISGTPQPMELSFSAYGLIVDLPTGEDVSNRVKEVAAGGLAEKAGVKPGDVIVAINTILVTNGRDVLDAMRGFSGDELTVIADRNGETVTFKMPGRDFSPEKDEPMGFLGFMPKQKLTRVGPVDSVVYGSRITYNSIKLIVGVIFSSKVKESVGGPLSIVSETRTSVKRGAVGYLELMAILSMSLGIVNLLPIPILDGGQIVLLFGEGIRRRRLSPETLEWAARVGLIAIGVLFIFILYLDFGRLFAGKLFK